jgi:hypothetical protein
MKLTLIFLISLQLSLVFGQSFELNTKELTLDLKGIIPTGATIHLTHAASYKDYFYCFFNDQHVDPKIGHLKKYCFVFSNEGKEIKRLIVPKAIQNSNYFDLFVKNDSLIVKTTNENQAFYFDCKKSKWVKTSGVDDILFEDKDYCVYSKDFGEWGGKTWFRDTKTNFEYAIEATTPLLTKLDSTYYLTCNRTILKIKNPKSLTKCEDRFRYANIEKEQQFTAWDCESNGYETIFKDTTEDFESIFFSSSNFIISSFTSKNQLYHIYQTNNGTYISTLENHSIKTLQKIGEQLQFFNMFNSYRYPIQEDGTQLLKFRSKNAFGFVVIKNQIMNTYVLKINN